MTFQCFRQAIHSSSLSFSFSRANPLGEGGGGRCFNGDCPFKSTAIDRNESEVTGHPGAGRPTSDVSVSMEQTGPATASRWMEQQIMHQQEDEDGEEDAGNDQRHHRNVIEQRETQLTRRISAGH